METQTKQQIFPSALAPGYNVYVHKYSDSMFSVEVQLRPVGSDQAVQPIFNGRIITVRPPDTAAKMGAHS